MLQNKDAGDYKCVATNDAGSSEGTATLTVRSRSSCHCCFMLFSIVLRCILLKYIVYFLTTVQVVIFSWLIRLMMVRYDETVISAVKVSGMRSRAVLEQWPNILCFHCQVYSNLLEFLAVFVVEWYL